MRILVLTVGSLGDVQPYIALGKGLQDAGHDVVMCTSSNFESYVAERGLTYAYMNDGLVRFLGDDTGRTAVEASQSLVGWLQQVRASSTTVKPVIRQMLQEQWEAAQGAEAIVYHPKAIGGYHLAQRLGIPSFIALAMPMTPTREFALPIFPSLRLGGWYNRLSYVSTRFMRAAFAGVVNRWRRDTLGLGPMGITANEFVKPDGQPVPTMYCYSRYVVPKPHDWPPSAAVTGYWFLDRAEDWSPDPDLTAFLAAGPPPVYVGFGSMAGRDPERTTALVLDALARSGQRGVIASGWGGLSATDLPDDVFHIDAVPHDWLFPEVSAVVHHGGAGTTGAGLRAGRPTFITPFFGDQPFWGRRVARLGLGPEPIHQKKLTVDSLTFGIRVAATLDNYRIRAAEIGQQIRAEDGVSAAVEFVHRQMAKERGNP